MYNREPSVTSVGNGKITRGWDQIREEADRHLDAGLAGKFRLAIGTVDVTPIGADHALALAKFNLTVADPSGAEVKLPGAMTLLFQKIEGEWRIIHDHTSYQAQDTADNQQTSAGASLPPTGGESQSEAATVHIADGRAIEIKPASYVHYTFQVPAASCVVTGRLVGISGGKKDFEAFIMDDDNFQNWSAGQQAMTAWQSGRVVVKSIESAVVTGPGTFHLVLSNNWSVGTAKTVQPQALAQCS
jgi:ketosteroid isomerase-like protein